MSLFEDGSTFSFWAGGHQVYGVCVIMANLIVLKMENSFNLWNDLIMVGHIAFFYVSVYYYQEFMDESMVYKFWWEFIGNRTLWLGVFLCIFSIITLDNILRTSIDTIRAILKDGIKPSTLLQRAEKQRQAVHFASTLPATSQEVKSGFNMARI